MTKKFWIYEEGFQLMEGSAPAHFIGEAEGENFLDACKNYIADGHSGEIRTNLFGEEYACDWGCRWFPGLEEAKRSFG